ncbi:MAG: GAF domain-containing protein, partial [Anaerolineales bacterium]
MKFWTKSLMARLVSYFMLLSLVTVILASYIAYLRASEALKQSVFERLNVAATLKEAELNRWVETRLEDIIIVLQLSKIQSHAQTLLYAEDESEYQAAYNTLKTNLENVLAIEEAFQEIFILSDIGGQVIFSTDKTQEGEYRVTDGYFTQGRLGNYIQNVYPSPITGKPTITLSTPLFDETGKRLGVLAAHLNIESLDEIMLERAGLGDTGETYLVNKFNVFVSEARLGEEKFLRGVHTEGIDAALEGNDGSGLYPNYEGAPVIGVYRWSEERDLALIAEIHQDEAFAPANQLARTILFSGLAIIFLLTGIIFLIARAITRPIRSITNTAAQVAAGNLNLEAPVLTQDEIGVLAQTFNSMTAQLRESIENLEQRVADRTHDLEHRAIQLQAAAEVGSAVVSIRDLDELLTQVTHLISDRFGYYHAGIFLIDKHSKYAVLQAANSPGGQRMLARGHRLKTGEVGIVGHVTKTMEPRIALDVGRDATYFDNPDLPETRSEMALPLISGGEILGVLDVQSTERAAFTQEDVSILQVMADQIAVAIENANLFTENQAALETARRAYSELSGEAWEELIHARPDRGYRSTVQGTTKISDMHISDVHKPVISLPIEVRGNVVGIMETYKPDEADTWNPKEIVILETILEQLGDALEGARLYEERRKIAEQERLVGEISNRIRA